MHFIPRDGGGEIGIRLRSRRINQRRIHIAALSRRRIERDILKPFACGRGSQTLGNLHLSQEIALVCCIACVPELVGKSVERRADEIFLCDPRRRARIETALIRDQRDTAAADGTLDVDVAALDVCRCRSVVLIEYARIAAVVVDGDLSFVLLEDQTCPRRIAAAGQLADMTAGKPGRYIRPTFFILPNATVLQPQIGLAFAIDEALQMGRRSIDCRIHAACRIFCHDMTVERYRTRAAVVVIHVDIDAAVVLCIQRRRFLCGSIRRRMEAAQCHRAAGCVYRLALLCAGDINLRRAGHLGRTARCTDAPSGLQRCRRGRVVHQQFQRFGRDVKILPIV